ncbi:peptidyl-prolyl cis-trans isomerase, partial [Aphanothece microscopica]
MTSTSGDESQPQGRLQRVAREPIVRFVALGGAIFLLHGLLRPPGAAPGGEIVVSEARAGALAAAFTRTWQRPPSRSELEALIDDHIRTELLVREAQALGLDRDDTIIRRRLRQKMEFFADDQESQGQPSDQELQAFLKAHPERFSTEPQIGFRQIFLDPQGRGEALAADAQRLLERLNGPEPPADVASLGDPLVLQPTQVTAMPKGEVAGLFGTDFADALVKQAQGRWVGPIPSGYGQHLVMVDSLEPGALPPLDQIRQQVEREWRAARSQENQQALYRQLLGKYRVTRPTWP